MSTMNFGERLFGARVGNQSGPTIGGRNAADRTDGRSTGSAEQPDPTSALAKLLEHYSDPGRFERMPIVIQSAVCDSAVALLRLATGERELREGRQFVNRHGLPHHLELLGQDAPPSKFRNWYDFSCFARNQRTWQIRIFRASQTLRYASSVAMGTDQLAQLIAMQIEREVTGAAFVGQVYTAARGRHGRPPAIEASLSYGAKSRGLLAMDGKDPVTEKDVLKVANDCMAAARLYPEYSWVQPVLVLPGGCDIRSAAVLRLTLLHRVMIATTALPTRPLGLSTRNVAR